MPEEHGLEYLLLMTMQPLLCVGLLLATFKRRDRDLHVGPRIATCRGASNWRTILLGLHAGLMMVLLMGEAAGDESALLSLLASVFLVLFVPTRGDLSCGDTGLSSGWGTLPYEQLHAWRFESGVLHFLMAGQWHELAVPAEARPRLRGILRGRAASTQVG